MRITQIVVEVEHRVSDDNYGSGRAQARLTADLDSLDVPHESLRDLLEEASAAVEAELLASPMRAVRRKLADGRKQRLCTKCQKPLADDEDYLHLECQRQRVGVAADDDDEPPF